MPVNNFFSHVGAEPPLPGYYQYFLDSEGFYLDRNENKIFHWIIRLDVKFQQLRFGEIDTKYNISGHRFFK